MSPIVRTHTTGPKEKKASHYSFVNLARSLLTVVSMVALPIVIATRLSEGRINTAVLIAVAGSGAIAGFFVAFQLYLSKKSH